MPQWLLTLCTTKKLVTLCKSPRDRRGRPRSRAWTTRALQYLELNAYVPSLPWPSCVRIWLGCLALRWIPGRLWHRRHPSQRTSPRPVRKQNAPRLTGSHLKTTRSNKYRCLLQVPSSHLQVASCLFFWQESILKSFSEYHWFMFRGCISVQFLTLNWPTSSLAPAKDMNSATDSSAIILTNNHFTEGPISKLYKCLDSKVHKVHCWM